MCAGWMSKLCLGVAVCVVGGCQSDPIASGSPSGRAPVRPAEPVAVADASPVQSSVAPVVAPPTALASAEPPVSQSDVLKWVARGTADDVILDRIQHAPNAIRLSAGQEMQLHEAGVTDEVIRAMKATVWN